MQNRFNIQTLTWKLFLFLFILFQVLFVFIAIYYYDIIIIEPKIKFVSREYWEWYINTPSPISYELQLIIFIDGVRDLSKALFIGGIIFFGWQSRKNKNFLKIFIVLCLLAFCLLTGWLYYARTYLYHFRIFMELIPSEIFSFTLLLLLLTNMRRLN